MSVLCNHENVAQRVSFNLTTFNIIARFIGLSFHALLLLDTGLFSPLDKINLIVSVILSKMETLSYWKPPKILNKQSIFWYNGKELRSFKTLNTLSPSGSFIVKKMDATERGTKVMYGILKKGFEKWLHLSLDDHIFW